MMKLVASVDWVCGSCGERFSTMGDPTNYDKDARRPCWRCEPAEHYVITDDGVMKWRKNFNKETEE